MNFENEQHYNECMNANAAAEAEYMIEMQYQEFLQSLIEKQQYKLHAIYVVMDMLTSKDYNKDMEVKEFLLNEKHKIENFEIKPSECNPDNLPF